MLKNNIPKPIAYRTKDILFNNNLEQEVMDILSEIDKKYVVKQLITFEKYLKSRSENIQNNVNGDFEFMDTCYIMNESAEIVDIKIMNLLSIYNDYNKARKQSLNNTPIMDDVKKYILEF